MNTIFIITALLSISGLALSDFNQHDVSNVQDISTYNISDTINKLIKSVKDALPEVITVSSLNVQLPKNNYLTGYLNLSNCTIKGIKEFNVNFTYLYIIPTAFSLTLDSISVYLEYLTDLALFNIPLLSIFGDGTGRISFTNLAIDGKMAVKLIPLNLSIKSVQINLGDAKFDFDGLLNDETFSKQANDILNDNFATIINENEHAISTVVEDVINTIISRIFSNSSTMEYYDNQILMDKDYYIEKRITQVFETLIEVVKSTIY